MAFPQTVRWINEILNNLSQVRLFLVPSGGVILWHGASNAVPKGWAICDGTNGTPDLRDRFVIGAGGKYGLDATGGAASATPDVTAGTAKTGIGLANASSNGTAGSAKTGINIQNASVAITTGAAATGIGIQGTTLDMNTLPSHGHTYHTNAHLGATGFEDRAANGGDTVTANTGNSWAHAHGVSDPGHTHSASAGQHGHGITDGGHSHTITTKAIDVMPPYVALFYIKKL